DWLVRVCEALGFAPSKCVLHRDLKPSNIMVGSFGEVYVMDWGVAKVLGRAGADDRAPDPEGADDVVRTRRAEGLQDDPTHTRYGTVFGTPAYMAPEQARGEAETL